MDFPPALQWARRPITFALQNMVVWGLGLAAGDPGLGRFPVDGVAGILRVRGEWRQHLLLWGWTGLYFAYQSYNWTRTMRYQMLVYPTLAIIAAWAVFALWPKPMAAAQRSCAHWLAARWRGCHRDRCPGADRCLGVCLYAHLYPPGDARRGQPLDLPERPWADQPADRIGCGGDQPAGGLPFGLYAASRRQLRW